MRTFSVVAVLALVGCGRAPDSAPDRVAAASPVDCAIGSRPMVRDCLIERDADTAIVIAPDGSFRRLRVVAGKWATADGADPIVMVPGSKDVVIGDWRIGLPAA